MTDRSNDRDLDPVTVVIPAYNLAAYLGDAIESVERQTYTGPMSIVVLDDGSTDHSLEVARKAAERSQRITVLTQSNQGRAATRNKLLKEAKTELIAWLDGDDLAAPSWIADQIEYLAANPDCVAVSGQGYSMTATANAIGPMTHPLQSEEIDRRHLDGEANAFFQSCVMVRKSAVDRAGAYNEKYPCAEDYDLWLRLAEVGRLANLTGVHLFYRVHATSANWTVNIDQRTQGHQILNEARVRRGLTPPEQPLQEIPPAKKDDWNRRLYWINIALKSGNPLSALQMCRPALRRHGTSFVLWMAAIVAACDTMLFWGNKTRSFAPGKPPQIGTLPVISFYRLGRRLNRIRRRLFA